MDKTAEQMLINKLDSVSEKLDQLVQHGCPRAADHQEIRDSQREIFKRLLDVETAQAEGRGKLAVAMVFLGAVISFGFQWLGNHVRF